ncbi:MAG: hypothetical protein GEU90_17595 [Gemmatimonas sp.]|nr:hypothetical protein [Gemmatimonas sp.]
MLKTRIAVVVALGAALAGCESEPISPEGEGEVWVGVRGDDGAETGASQSISPSGEASGEASVAVDARVYLGTEAGDWVEVTEEGAQQTVRADGSDGVQALANSGVEAGTYSRVRVEFEHIRASVSGEVSIGLSLGEAELGVELGSDDQVVVERELAVRVRSGAQSRLTIDLNADAWLSQADVETRMVAEGSFESAVEITAE